MIPWREEGLKAKMWAWPHTERILQQNTKHCAQARAKAPGSPTLCHQLRRVPLRIRLLCVLVTRRNTGVFIRSRPAKHERHPISCPGDEPLLNSPSRANVPADASLRTPRRRSCQEHHAQPFSRAHRSQTISPAVFRTRTQHLHWTFYLLKYVMFS